MCDLISFRVKHVAVSIPNLDVTRTLPLFHDFLHCDKCRGKVIDGNDAPASAGDVLVGNLLAGIATEDIHLAQGCGKFAKSPPDRFIELANCLVIFTIG